MTKLCKNCEHSRRDLMLGWEFAKCTGPSANIDLITGVSYSYCSVSREFDFRCGELAINFKQTTKHPIIKWLGF